MRNIFLLAIIYYINAISDGSVNYCGARMCAHTNTHTFCRYPPGPSPSCRGYINTSLSPAEKSRILERLNRRRSDIARGLRRLPTAGDMLKLRWVEELAREAQRWADQCVEPAVPEERDTCRDLYSISVGQCVASVVGEAPGLRPETMVDMWYMQSKDYKGNATSYIPPKSRFNYYGDFAQITWSRTYMVGCGRSSFMISWHDRLRSVQRLVCNFAPRGPVPLRPIWSPAIPASVCPPRSRPDDDMPVLCAYQRDMDETFDEDNIMTLEEHLLLNTVFETERNITKDYIVSFDEIYLTKLAVATMDNTLLTTLPHNAVQKLNIDIAVTEVYIINDTRVTSTVENFHIKFSNILKSRKKGNFAGRPKAYRIEDLDDLTTEPVINENHIQETTVEKHNWGDYDFVDTIDTTPLTTVTKTTTTIYGETFSLIRRNRSKSLWLGPDSTVESIKHEINITSIPKDVATASNNTASKITSTEDLDVYNDILSHLNITQILNKTDEDILNDPESVRQLEEALNRMENKLAEPQYTGKVRRELRNDENSNKNTPNEIERNKSLERGPMLNMVLKYLPYLKPYEKTIVGDTTSNNGASLSPYLIFIIILFL